MKFDTFEDLILSIQRSHIPRTTTKKRRDPKPELGNNVDLIVVNFQSKGGGNLLKGKGKKHCLNVGRGKECWNVNS